MGAAFKLGPADHGRPVPLDAFMAADYAEGYQYELIDGKLYVSPQPNLPENWVEEWLAFKIRLYAKEHPKVINYVSEKARVFVPGRRDVTNPEPDIAAYHNFPARRAIRRIRWQDVSPLLVVEILSAEDPDKDLVRNVELYFQVPSIKEYWLLDTLRADPERPHLRVHRRFRGRWQILDFEPGETYTPKILPGFELTLDPRHA